MDTDKLSLRLTEINRSLERIAGALEDWCRLETENAAIKQLTRDAMRQARKEKGNDQEG